MKKFLCIMLSIALYILSLPTTLLATTYAKVQGYASQGGSPVSISGLSSSTKWMQSYPSCTITIYDTGTTNLSTIYSDNIGTPKVNPFTSTSTSYFEFYGIVGTQYDVRFSGTGISSAFTLTYLAGLPGTVLSDPMTTAGDIITRNISNTTTRLGIGTSGQVLTVSGGVPSWQTPTAGFADPMSARGDTIYRNSSNVTARLGVGSQDTFLGSDGTDLSYRNIAKIYDKGGLDYNVKAYGAVGDGSTDDTIFIQNAIAAAGNRGIVVFPKGQYKITSTITIGDGSISAQSTINSISIIGTGMGAGTAEGSVNAGGTELLWYGAANGTMMQVNGPIYAVHIEGLHFNCQPSTNAANTAINLIHPYHSTFERISATKFTGIAYKLTAYPNPTGVAIGASHNYFEQVRTITGTGGSAEGIRIGEATTGTSPFLDVAGATFVKCSFNVGTTPGMIGIELRFTDYMTFIDCSTLGAVGVQATGVTDNIAFPGDITFFNSSIGGNTGVSGAWTPQEKIRFIPYPIGDGQVIPTNAGFAGITTDNKVFGNISFRDGITGTITNDSASTGNIGEYVEATLASGSAVALSTGTAKTITSVSLTAGDWDVTGQVIFGTANTYTELAISYSLTTNTFDSSLGRGIDRNSTIATGGVYAFNGTVQRFSIASTTTVYLIGFASFAAGSADAYGILRARRVR